MKYVWESVWSKGVKRSTIHFKQFRKVEELAGKLEGMKFLEVGCGSGVDSAALHRNYGTENYCLDFSREALKITRKNFDDVDLDAHLIMTDLENIPFPDRYFDVVFSNGVMEHYKNLCKPLTEQRRVLKDEGILVIGVPYAYNLYQIKRAAKNIFCKWKYGWERGLTLSYLERALDIAGMEVVSHYYDSHPRLYLPSFLRGGKFNFIINGGIVTFAKKLNV